MPIDETSVSVQPCRGFTCGACSSPLIQPLEWDSACGHEWSVLVRCPECFQLGSLDLTQEQAQQFHNMLDQATHDLEETADMLDLQVFKETSADFARMLREGHVRPMDF